jgi:hypothetical protein
MMENNRCNILKHSIKHPHEKTQDTSNITNSSAPIGTKVVRKRHKSIQNKDILTFVLTSVFI